MSVVRVGKNILRFLLLNAPTLVIIAFVGFVLLASDRDDTNERELLQWTLATVGLLATSMLIERTVSIRRLELLAEDTNKLVVASLDRTGREDMLGRRVTLELLERRLATASTVWMSGGSLSRVIHNHVSLFEEKARAGCHFQFLLLDPNSQAAVETARSVVYEMPDPAVYVGQIGVALGQLWSFLLERDDAIRDHIAVKTTDVVPTCGLVILDPDELHGRAWVELYPFKSPVGSRPVIYVTKSGDPEWFAYFVDRFRRMWAAGTPWTGPTP
ncbi:MAG: hypothetical protein M3198_01475 [Actinomycetota bacterium]|nr:hypothetical protein [Actinomycetota bacterium]